MPPAPLALRARLAELDGCWLEVRCGRCTRVAVYPVALLIRKRGADRQLGAILALMKCSRCHTRPAEAWLNETPNRERHGGAAPGWTVRLIPGRDPAAGPETVAETDRFRA